MLLRNKPLHALTKPEGKRCGMFGIGCFTPRRAPDSEFPLSAARAFLRDTERAGPVGRPLVFVLFVGLDEELCAIGGNGRTVDKT